VKLSSLTAFFVYKVSREVMAKFCQNPDLCGKVKSVQISPSQQPSHVLIAVTRKLLTIWSREMNHQKMERVI
jgi:intein-encoded DNA endonuclease-like protein